MKNFSHPLMDNNFTSSDILAVKKILQKKNIVLTQSKKVEEFEKKWSQWLGVKYSTYFSSISSINLLGSASINFPQRYLLCV